VSSRSPFPRVLAVGAALLVGAGILFSGPAASADVDDFEFESLHVEYELTRDADGTSQLRTIETFVALFPDFDQNRGIVRDIPTRERIDGFGMVDRGVSVVGVTDGSGEEVPYERSTWTDDDGTEFVSLALGTDDFVQGRTTYVIEWTARDVILPLTDPAPSDDFYWDVNGTGWAQPFGSLTAEVRLGDGLAEAFADRLVCYSDGIESCDFAADGDGFALDAGPLDAFGNATIAIGFEPGTFRSPTPLEQSWVFTVLPWVLIGVLAAETVLIILLRSLRWRHAPGRGIVIPEYEGPDDAGVLVAATLVGRPKSALPAQLVRLATEGAVRLVEDPEEPLDRRYRLEILDASAVTGSDRKALSKLFGGKKKATDGATLVLDRKDVELGDRVSALVTESVGSVRARGYLAEGSPSPLRRLIFWPGLAVAGAGIAGMVYSAVTEAATALLVVLFAVAIVGGFLVVIFSGKPLRRTARGAEVYDRLLGLREYLRVAEADRLRVLQSPEGAVRERIDPSDPAAVVRLYERLLPWAIVWGVEKEWGRVLADHYDESITPSSGLAIDPSLIAVSTLGRSFASGSFATTASTTSSSGSGGGSFSGGSFGGGFSGGGGGGGGGGGR
jgi:uncharacterized membrane protein YgcG